MEGIWKIAKCSIRDATKGAGDEGRRPHQGGKRDARTKGGMRRDQGTTSIVEGHEGGAHNLRWGTSNERSRAEVVRIEAATQMKERSRHSR